MKRPYFSVIIACYNDGRYEKGKYLDRLLNSLVDQGLEEGEMEVILSDDCSPVPFDDIVEPYKDKFIIKRTKTDYNKCPGNTRAKGVEIATGEWICFADHDDMYYPKAFIAVKNAIIERNEQHFIFSDFTSVDPDGTVKKNYKCTLNWCHGKWYNFDNFWKRYNLHFIPDLESHEDIAICTQAACAFTNILKELSYLAVATYAWTDNPQSVSHAKYYVDGMEGPRYFLEVYFRDYINVTGDVYLNEFDSHMIKMNYAITRCVEILVYCYIYTQGFQFRRPDFVPENLVYAGEFLNKIKSTFNVTNDQVYDAVAENDAAIYRKIRPLADPGAGAYIPQQSLREWLDLIDSRYKEAKETNPQNVEWRDTAKSFNLQ